MGGSRKLCDSWAVDLLLFLFLLAGEGDELFFLVLLPFAAGHFYEWVILAQEMSIESLEVRTRQKGRVLDGRWMRERWRGKREKGEERLGEGDFFSGVGGRRAKAGKLCRTGTYLLHTGQTGPRKDEQRGWERGPPGLLCARQSSCGEGLSGESSASWVAQGLGCVCASHRGSVGT